MKTLLLGWAAFGGLMLIAPVGTARAADLGVDDLPSIHSEYKANQARWAEEYKGKTFEATLTVGKIGDAFNRDLYMVTFMENTSDWLPGVACEDVPPSEFLRHTNAGEHIRVYGVITDHSFGSVDLSDCRFGTPLTDLTGEIAAQAEAERIRQVDADERARWAEEQAAAAEAARQNAEAARQAEEQRQAAIRAAAEANARRGIERDCLAINGLWLGFAAPQVCHSAAQSAANPLATPRLFNPPPPKVIADNQTKPGCAELRSGVFTSAAAAAKARGRCH